MATKNIMIVGVGGQGSLLASRILGNAVLLSGYDVKVSEVHGMSQRGGSVVTYVKYGDKVASPVICKGEADIIMSFELLEAARWLPFLKKDGVVITNTQQINPMPVVTGAAEYPAELVSKMKAAGANVIAADALAIAREAGSEKAVNVALIGLMANALGFDTGILHEAIRMSVPEKFLELNMKAFALGAAHKA
ncbi:MAG: indolepyruvate oxidoreductase subunit beta [Ruminococcaceae bacterium]|nr:indolepyruvate oxidoreductase subunit beta [Oscillospiraceae bacterium]